MREIKFRAWDKRKNKIGFPISIDFADRAIFMKEYLGTGVWMGFDRVVLMQYTGLKDKNGKEIYEGDIVEIYHNKIRQKVFFYNGCFVCSVDGYPLNHHLLAVVDQKDIEIIGNTYENPKLLGVNNKKGGQYEQTTTNN